MKLLRLLTPPARRWWLACFVVGLLLTLVVTLLPADKAPAASGWDKLDHLLAFLALGFVGVLALHWHRRGVRLVVPILVMLGAVIEVGQSFTATRHADVLDLLADVIGAVLGALLGWCAVQAVDPEGRHRRKP